MSHGDIEEYDEAAIDADARILDEARIRRIAQVTAEEMIRPHAERLGRVHTVLGALDKSIRLIPEHNPSMGEYTRGTVAGLVMARDLVRAALEDNLDELVETSKAWRTGTPDEESDR